MVQRELSGCDDLSLVTKLDLVVDTTVNSLSNFGVLLPNLQQLKLSNSIIRSVRSLKNDSRRVYVREFIVIFRQGSWHFAWIVDRTLAWPVPSPRLRWHQLHAHTHGVLLLWRLMGCSFDLKELYVAFNQIRDCSPVALLEHLQILDLEGFVCL